MDDLLHIITAHAELWRALRERTVVVTTTRGGERAFHRPGDVSAEAARLAEVRADAATLAAICATLTTSPPEHPCVVDVVQALALVRDQGLSAAEAVTRARVRYQGTDGVRGKVAPDDAATTPLAKLVDRGEFTPHLCELLTAGLMLARGGRPARVVLAEDGRDAFGERRYARAVIRACRRFGCEVLDLGICPTPVAPLAAAKLDAEVAAVVTASHNPADQNGVKFFIDGRKPLPETGDYPISTFTFLAALEGLPEERTDATVERVACTGFMREVLASALGDEDLAALRRACFVIDVAHGSFAPMTEDLLDELGIDVEIINADMTGENINRDSGVAYIEGRDHIAGSEVDAEIEIVGRTRDASLAGDVAVFGLAVDADGDRGFLLVHDAGADEVRIIDGDRIAYLVAKLARENSAVNGRVFAGTVESDLAVFDAVGALGIETVLTPVGDKWLSARTALTDRLLVGEEPSGHIVLPVEIATPGGPATVVTGNGLVTGLLGASAALRLGMTPSEAADLYPAGVFRSLYCYFVDRARFHRGSPVWEADLEIAHAEVARLKAADELPESCELAPVDFDDDPDMLYLRLVDGARVLGALFARNSGTENRSAVYARGKPEWADALGVVVRRLNENHIRAMKDRSLVETRASDALAEAVADAADG
ncbi:MAG TPA: hypothetical protein VMY39_06275, partial [Planctomycetota bacterium]|nr:hypothetical protein [Planctomycetota bacterium]